MRSLLICLVLLCINIGLSESTQEDPNKLNIKPNIMIIIADDLGWADVGYHNKNISTPNIDALAQVRLENYYTHPTCTPSRSALMTGKYSFYTGLHNAMLGLNPYGIDDHHLTIAQKLKPHSYKSYYIGKWHLGHAKIKYTPTRKGFDYFYGIYNGMANNYEQRLETFHDLHENEHVAMNRDKVYSTHLYTQKFIDKMNEFKVERESGTNHSNLFMVLSYQALHTPLEVPDKYLDTDCKSIINTNRKNYCGMLMTVDESIKNITDALKQNGMWNNTIIFFTTDNGGQTWSGALNYPYRGMKHTLYEGGVKGVGFFGGGYFDRLGSASNNQFSSKIVSHDPVDFYGLMHIADIAPTILGFANITDRYINKTKESNESICDHEDGGYSGDNMMKFIVNQQSKPNKMVVPFFLDGQITARDGRYKIIINHHGDSHTYDNYDNNTLIGDGVINKMFYLLTELIPEDAIFWKELVREARLLLRDGVQKLLFVKPKQYLIYDLDTDPYENNDLCESTTNTEWCNATFHDFITRINSHINISGVHNYPFDDMDPAYKHNCNNVHNTCFSNSWIHDDVDVKTLPKTNFLRFYVRRWIKQRPRIVVLMLTACFKMIISNAFLLLTCIVVMYVSISNLVRKRTRC
ncbi:hypothetical protein YASMINEVIRUS_800 [Yasminevirus sp. GU-2018]|uniref:Sulfatase N-terminal domain-containing protein n=1 Tax=Yasminevirus sp. GU-2018 TaxID=2420051 RepID=A0A5K0U8V6_9VIRU|nr:hypothetical protein YASMINEVIRUS_800 [Yasminevirus sp. GU-2018]